MALRVGQTSLVLEDQLSTGHLRVGQTALIIEAIPPPTGHLRVGQTNLILEASVGNLLPSLIGGGFQDPLGVPYAGGTITFQLSVDAVGTIALTSFEVSSKTVIKGNLDAFGNIIQPFYIWPNSLLTPNNTYYKVKVRTAGGQLVWFSPIVMPDTITNFSNLIPQQ